MTVRTVRLGGAAPAGFAAFPICATLLLLVVSFSAWAAPKAQFWGRWAWYDDSSDLTIDHSAWSEFLSKYVHTDVRGVNRVAYGEVSPADRRALDAYIERLSIAPISTYSRDVQLAYWINLYNALTVRLIVDYYPVESIRDIDISPGWFVEGPWRKKLVEVEGVALSLDDIENRILRPIWKDPRIHYVLHNGSVGSPNLRKVAFTGETVDALLTRAAREFVNSPRAAGFEDGELYVSSLYKWYEADFGGSPIGVLIHLRKYADRELRERLGAVEGISEHRYDWALDDDRGAVRSRRQARRLPATSVLFR